MKSEFYDLLVPIFKYIVHTHETNKYYYFVF